MRSEGRRAAPTDLVVQDSGMVFADGKDRLDYLWFRVLEREGGHEYDLYRVVQLKMLRYLPQETRQEAGLLDTMRAALTGLYNQRTADYDPCMVVAGIFEPPLGVVQCYGAVGIGGERDEAIRNARLGLAAVEGVLANFPQSRLEPLDIQKAEWLRRAFLEMNHSLVIIGQPDPRLSAKGMGREGPGEKPQITLAGESAYTQQQNEMLFRSLARLQEEFLFLILASRVKPRDLAGLLEAIASEASVVASRQTGAKAITFGLSFPLMASGGLGQNAGTNYGKNESQSVSDSVGETDTTSHIVGHATTTGRAVTDGWAHTVGHATSSGGSTSTSVTTTEGINDTVGKNYGTAHTTGSASTIGGSSSVSTSVTNAPAVTSFSGPNPENRPWELSLSRPASMDSTGVQVPGLAVPEDRKERFPPISPLPPGTDPNSLGLRPFVPSSLDEAIRYAQSGYSAGTITYNPPTQTRGQTSNSNAQISAGVPQLSVNVGTGQTQTFQLSSPLGPSAGIEIGARSTSTNSSPEGNPTSSHVIDQIANVLATGDYSALGKIPDGLGLTFQTSGGETMSTTSPHTIVSSSTSSSSFASSTSSTADTVSQGVSFAHGVSQSVARTTATSSFFSSTDSVADTTSHSETNSWSTTDSTSDGVSHGVSVTHGVGRASGTTVGRALSVGRMMGLGAGVVPSIAATKSYQWWDDKAVQLTQILRAQEELLRLATLEGAWLTDAYMLCRTERGAAAAEAAIRQAFHGSQLPVVTPVQTRRLTQEEQGYIRLHAMAFTQSAREERIAGALEAYKDSTLLLPLQLAAYMAPGMFEEGPAVTTQERTPAFAFVPDMPGDVVLGHLWSTETGRLTPAQLRLSEARMFHTAFVADTGYGKTVAAERLAVETTAKWKYRTVVLDFGAGWRRLLNAPLGEPGRVEVWQVFPGAVAPIRWNPLQIGKRVDPERQMRATCELIRNAGQMGPRQLGFMRRALKKLYLEAGVLISYREVLEDPRWSVVRPDEWEVLERDARERGVEPRRRQADLRLSDLEYLERQALAVHRSKQVCLSRWYEELMRLFERVKPGTPDHTALEGVLLRVEPFCEGEMERMYGQGEGSMAIEDLGMLGPADDPWGISILEGGAEMDEFAKAVIFSLVAWHLYNDAVVRRRQSIGCARERKLQIFFEEANKVLGGVAASAGEQEEERGGTSDLWLQMWRDGRKYGIWLHVIAQTVSELPDGILSSCNNAFYSQTKNPKDRDIIMAHLAFSEKGFTDEDYKRFLSRMPVAQAICKLGYSADVMHTTPFLCRPVLVPGQEPSDSELLAQDLAMRAARKGERGGSVEQRIGE